MPAAPRVASRGRSTAGSGRPSNWRTGPSEAVCGWADPFPARAGSLLLALQTPPDCASAWVERSLPQPRRAQRIAHAIYQGLLDTFVLCSHTAGRARRAGRSTQIQLVTGSSVATKSLAWDRRLPWTGPRSRTRMGADRCGKATRVAPP